MSGYDDWNRPPRDEEKPEETAEEKAPPPDEWDAESRWPSFDRPGYQQQPSQDRPEESESQWRRSDYGGYGETQVPRDPFLSSTSGDRYHDHRSRDPLARLFPGLPRSVRVTLDWILTIAGAILIVLALKQWVVNPYRIPSSSMEPTLNCARGPTEPGCLGTSSDRVLACRICLDFGPPARNDIVVFNTPTEAALKCGEGGTFVKRVIGLPGETVREDDNGFIWVEAPGAKKFVKLKEPFISAQARLADTAHFGQVWHVKPNSYFMMGDNRSQSCDSRTWGSVPRNKLIGTVFFVYWPPDRIGFR
ncbi:MAG TPA: signal peptidase I [Gaiellaceae bacterium]|nr:signal peptidase I [Gaiellaceae bacterium]